jgi:hypothetical protein
LAALILAKFSVFFVLNSLSMSNGRYLARSTHS